MPHVEMTTLEGFCAAILAGAGMTAADAALVAAHLVDAEVKGVVSHGVQRVPYYLGEFANGGTLPAADLTVTRRGATLVHVDGGRGLGIPAMEAAVDEALALGRDQPLVAAAIVNVSHTGRMGRYSERLAEAGRFAMVLGGGGAGRWTHVAPYGGRRGAISTNPYALAMPGGRHGVVSADFATSATANGKIRLRRTTGEDLPEGWIIDGEGRPTVKVADNDAGGAILPAAGPKGYGMALIGELVALALPTAPHEFNWLLLCLDLDAFGGGDAYPARAEQVIEGLRATPPAPGFDRVRVAGDPEREKEAACRERGVPLHDAIWAALVAAAGQTGVAVPEVGS